jgi:8-amino-7-oxononanoate synthase
VLGNGSGIYAQLPDLPQVQRVVIASLAKACGVPAGIVLGPPGLLAQLRAMPFYAGASPTVPAYLYAFVRAQRVYQHKLAILRQNVAQFADLVADLGLFSCSPGYPVFFTSRNDLYHHLLAQRILVSSFPYPRADAPPITRVVVNCLHTSADLAQLNRALRAR